VAKATELVQRIAFPMLEACGFDALTDRSFDLVVNATSTGLSGEVPRIPANVFRKGALAYELVYGRDTGFLAMARASGAATSDGTGMLVEQAADSFRLWRGVRPQTAGVISALASIVHLAATLSGASTQTRSVLGYVGGSAAGVSGLFSRLMAHPPPGRATDPTERMHTLDLETDLRDSIHETEVAAELLWVELRGMALDSCMTVEQVVWLARRYANALHGTSVIIDSRIATSMAIARSCAQYPEFAAESRDRCGALASHLDAVGALCQKWQWMFERSKRNTLDYLVLADHPRLQLDLEPR
jgi:hypothetical protein